MPSGPLPHNVALEGRIVAVLREAGRGMTAREIAQCVGTIGCACADLPTTAAVHRSGKNTIGSCHGTGWRPAMDTDIRRRMDRLLRHGLIHQRGIAGGVAWYLPDTYEPEPIDVEDMWANERFEVTAARVMNDR